jgi:hypothetical protein
MKVDFRQVQQRGDGDCGVACFAMFTGESYERCRELLRFKANAGTSEAQMIGALAYHFDVRVSRTDGWADAVPGILTVPSLNMPGRLHFVVWTGSEVLDPQQGMAGQRAYTKEMLSYAVVSQIYSHDIEAL